MGDTLQELLSEQLGKGGVEIVVSGTGAVDTGTNVTGTDTNLHQTYVAGTTLYLSFTAITISSGLALIYKNDTL